MCVPCWQDLILRLGFYVYSIFYCWWVAFGFKLDFLLHCNIYLYIAENLIPLRKLDYVLN